MLKKSAHHPEEGGHRKKIGSPGLRLSWRRRNRRGSKTGVGTELTLTEEDLLGEEDL